MRFLVVNLLLLLSHGAAADAPEGVPAAFKAMHDRTLKSVCVPGKDLAFKADGTMTAKDGKSATTRSLKGRWEMKEPSSSADEIRLEAQGDVANDKDNTKFMSGIAITKVESLGKDQFDQLMGMYKQMPKTKADAACPAAADFAALVKRGAVVVEGTYIQGLYQL